MMQSVRQEGRKEGKKMGLRKGNLIDHCETTKNVALQGAVSELWWRQEAECK